MQGLIALSIFSLWLVWMFYRDGKERSSVSSSTWLVLFWVFIHATRPVTMWLGWESHASRDEGNTTEALVNLILIAAGIGILWRGNIQWRVAIRDNAWFLLFYLFWCMSIFWSDYPLITFKRLFKDIGNVFMVLIVLTEREPDEAIKAICARLAYLCIPLSIIFIRYYPQMGRAFVGDHGASMMYIGVATHKNMLGVLVFVLALFILWDLLEKKNNTSTGKFVYASRGFVLVMCWYLLFLIDSVTSLICTVIGSALILLLRRPSFRQNPRRIEAYGLGIAAVLILLSLMFNFKEVFFEGVGRNSTLTSRTDIWEVVHEYQDNPVGGQGFDTFWAGRRLLLLYDRTAGIVQAHNGYLETYLNGGMIGVGFLIILLILAYNRIRKKLNAGSEQDCIRFVILLTAIIHNYTEASFNKLGVLWFVTSFAIMEYHIQRPRPLLMPSALRNGIALRQQPIPSQN